MAVVTTHHPQVHISLDDMEADVDDRLAPTILALWREGFETSYSCLGKGYLDEETVEPTEASRWFETAYIVFSFNYLIQEWDIQLVLMDAGWIVLDLFSWDSGDPTVPVRTVARFVEPGTII